MKMSTRRVGVYRRNKSIEIRRRNARVNLPGEVPVALIIYSSLFIWLGISMISRWATAYLRVVPVSVVHHAVEYATGDFMQTFCRPVSNENPAPKFKDIDCLYETFFSFVFRATLANCLKPELLQCRINILDL